MSSAIFYFVDEIESTFVLSDLIIVAEKYERVYLFSIEKLSGKEFLPSNVHVFEEFMEWESFRPMNILLKNFFSIFEIYISECIKVKNIIPLKSSIALLVSNIFKASEISRNLDEKSITYLMKTSAFYSFWFYDCNYLAWLRKKGVIGFAITRTHSGDLYEDHISIRNKPLFRNFQMKYLDAVLPVSKMGTQYLQNRYNSVKCKIKTIFLGSRDPNVLNPFVDKKLVIVSCASLRHHKRIHKVAESLLHVDIPVTWHHFGSENLDTNDPMIPEYLKRKEQLKTKLNIEFIPHGFTSNEKLFEFYKGTPVNLFISLSEAEGIPVSIMEAISFGIPVLSTDVGGCSEIVTEQTGILIPLNTEVSDVASRISDFKHSTMNTIEFRKQVRKFWESNFDERVNYHDFFEVLLMDN